MAANLIADAKPAIPEPKITEFSELDDLNVLAISD
jgi:hypothetical protein